MATLNPAVGENAYTETLSDLRTRVLRRLGFGAQTATPPPGMADLINDFLQSAQTLVAKKYPMLRTERFYEWTMVAGTRFYSLSGDDEGTTSPEHVLDPHSVKWVGIEDLNGAFFPMYEGIPPEWYTTESNRGLPERYEIRQAIEVMPSPDAAYKLIIKGHTKNFTFTGDSDVCTIDPELIFLLALANAKAHYQQPDAQNYFTQATSYLGDLIAGGHGTRRYVPKSHQDDPPPPQPTMV